MNGGDNEDKQLLFTATRPIERWTTGAKLLAAALLAVVLFGAYAFVRQWRDGLGVTGLNYPNFWGIYVTNLIFFIGISYAGTLISAVLRITGAEWRKPLTRMAETITVLALLVAPFNVIFDLGRPDRMLFILMHPHFTSPLLWDVGAIGTYTLASIVYFSMPLIPDLAILRDRYPQRRLYRWLALGWSDTETQRRILKKIISVMAILVIPVAVSGHTVLGWVFAMTVQPMWHSTIFGPYFVIGAIFSGIATLLVVMAILRRVYRLEAFVQPKHFEYLGYLLITFTALWAYFTFAELLTTFYGSQPDEMRVFLAKLTGEFADPFWIMVFCMVGALLILSLPLILVRAPQRASVRGPLLRAALAGVGMLAFIYAGRLSLQPSVIGYPQRPIGPYLQANLVALGYHSLALVFLVALVWNLRSLLSNRPVLRTVCASALVIIGMWLERYLIVVPSLSHPRLPLSAAAYHPTWVEWSETAGCFALLALLFLVFSRLFPMLPLWEMTAEEHKAQPSTAANRSMREALRGRSRGQDAPEPGASAH